MAVEGTVKSSGFEKAGEMLPGPNVNAMEGVGGQHERGSRMWLSTGAATGGSHPNCVTYPTDLVGFIS
jgi:hypothetical protein